MRNTLIVSIILLCVFISMPDTAHGQKSVKPTLAQELLKDGCGLSFDIDDVHLDEKTKTVVYETQIAGQKRIITYAFPKKELVRVSITNGRKREMLKAEFVKGKVTGKAAGKSFTLTRKNVKSFPKNVDKRAFWLLSKNLIAHPTLGGEALLASFGESENVQTMGLPAGVVVIIGGIAIVGAICHQFPELCDFSGNSDCSNPNQITYCTGQDAGGNENTITFTCDCGTPICDQVHMTVSVQVLEKDSNGNVTGTRTEERDIVQCACQCLELSEGSYN